MKLRNAISALTISAMVGAAGAGAAVAQQGTASATGSGTAAATDKGAVAGRSAVDRDRDHDRRNRNRDRTSRQYQSAPNASSTYGSGAVYTDRNSTSAGVTSGGSASGTGVQSTTSTVDAYGETTRDGTSADIYGNSTATSGQTPRQPSPR
jgi:hypothetical protein